MLGGGVVVVASGVVVVVPGTVVDDALVIAEPAVTIRGATGDAEGGEVVTPDGVMLLFG